MRFESIFDRLSLVLWIALLAPASASGQEWTSRITSDSAAESSTSSSAPTAASDEDGSGETALGEQPVGVPLRVRDFTFPSYLVLDFAPQPAAALGKGRWAFELVHSKINNFQVSPEVEDYLGATRRNGERRALSVDDAEFILGLPSGKGYYIDGEFDFTELRFFLGLTDRLDIGLSTYYIEFSGGSLDGTIFDFHDQFDFGQQGRNFVLDDNFQIVVGAGGVELVRLDGPPDGGLGDPSLFLRYALRQRDRGWSLSLSGGVKPSVVDAGPRSSGGIDVGASLTADRRWRRSALIFGVAVVEPGDFEALDLDPPLLGRINAAYLYRFARWPNTRFILQALAAEHILSEATDSGLTELELQMTAGLKWNTRFGVLGLGLTENLLNYDNTPDIGVHVSWGYLSK